MDRNTLVKRLREESADKAHALAEAHGYDLFDIKCGSCVYQVSHYAIQRSSHRDAIPEHDYAFLVCPKCGTKGNWSHVSTPRPKVAAPKEVAKAAPVKPVAQREKYGRGARA